MLADDAAAWVTMLRNDGRFSAVAIAGHSEGSLVGMLAAGQVTPDGFVSLAGPGRPFPDVLRDQLRRNLGGELRREALRIVDELAAERMVERAPQELASLFRPSVQPYLISAFRYDPAGELANLAMPILVIQGTTDIQESIADAERLASANQQAELRVFEGLNYLLKPARTEFEQSLSYRLPIPPMAPEVIDAVAAFAKRLPPSDTRGSP